MDIQIFILQDKDNMENATPFSEKELIAECNNTYDKQVKTVDEAIELLETTYVITDYYCEV